MVKALVIEDYKPLRNSLAKAIREMGWVVDVAADGEEGLWLAENHPCDVIVLDLMLPKLDGLLLLSRFREKGHHTPVIILTAKDTVGDRTKGLDLGADDYLVKPFFLGELMSRLKALVRRSYRQECPLLRVGDLEIDTNARRVARNGEEITLTAREYALLEYLARRKGEVVTRTEIWSHVYDSYGDSASNVVDVYVGYLRKKLQAHARAHLLHTRRGLGYVLQDDPEK